MDRFDSLLSSPNNFSLVLFYGPNEGLVFERAERFVDVLSAGNRGAVVRLYEDSVLQDPSTLIVEMSAVPLFSDRRIVRLRGVGRRAAVVSSIESAMRKSSSMNVMVVEGGDLPKTSVLFKLIGRGERATAVPCYLDDSNSVASIIDEELGFYSKSVDQEAKAVLMSLLGGDRLVIRSELKKLCLYAYQKRDISREDIEASIGDCAWFVVNDIVDRAAVGDICGASRLYSRLMEAGVEFVKVLRLMIKHFYWLQVLVFKLNHGISLTSITAEIRALIFFKRVPSVTEQVRLWRPLPKIEKAIAILNEALSLVHKHYQCKLGKSIVFDALMSIAQLSKTT